MAKKYIKSHSNYVLKTKHQQTNDGIIYERDITTIGGRDQFAKGQVPIYRTGNFVITTNNDSNTYKKVTERDWHRSDEGEIWTINTLKGFEKDEKSSYDKKIVIKKDYLDLRDYAYYGSCSELMRVSIEDILKNYPGELFIPYETIYTGTTTVDEQSITGVQYTEEAAEAAFDSYASVNTGIKGYYTSLEERKSRVVTDSCGNDMIINSVSLIDPLTDEEKEELKQGIPYTREFKYITDKNGNIVEEKSLSLIDNPFEINIHDRSIQDKDNPLKYFANGGIDNYVGYLKLDENDEISIDGEWKMDSKHEYAISIEDITLDGLGEQTQDTEIFDYEDLRPTIQCNDGSYIVSDGKIHIYASRSKKTTNSCLQTCIDPGKYIGKVKLCFRKIDYSFKTTPGLKRDDDGNPMEMCCNGSLSFPPGGGEGKFPSYNGGFDTQIDSYSTSECKYELTIYMFMGNNNEIKYLVENADSNGEFKWENFVARIRPNKKVINEYFDKLDLFEKVLLNRDTDPIYTANFELINDDDYGAYTYTKQFTFPTTYGGWNLGSNNQAFAEYVSSLSDIGEYYDSKFTDNLWRSMTHESIKNFDWTYTRHYTPGEEEPFIEGGNKIKKTIRIYGREFDEVKSYIDAIDDLNTVTYDNINNIPDYFFTDKLEESGWDVTLVYPLELSEFVNGHDNVPIDIHQLFENKYDEDGNEITTEDAEKLNYFYDTKDENKNKITIQRVFNQKNTHVFPYSISNISSDDTGNTGTYENDCGETIKIYSDENDYSSAKVNNEFIKRLYLNSKEIWKHKGTIEGIEMLLSIFGLRSKSRIYTDEKYFVTKKDEEGGDCLSLTENGEKYYKNYEDKLYNLYDYDVKEYTLFTTREEDEWLPTKNMYKLDWVNSTKLVTYANDNGTYESYKGLPVSYRETKDLNENKIRYIYPHFNSYVAYDGNPYYQMDGGWMQKKPFMFDSKNNIVVEDSEAENRKNKSLFTETIKNIKCVNTIQDLLSNPSLADKSGDICQVTDLSGRFAVIDGFVYPLLSEITESEGSGNTFFYATVHNNSLSVGNALFTDYVIISNPYFPNNKQKIDLTNDYYSDREIKIYILEKTDEEENEETVTNENEEEQETEKIKYDIDVYSKNISISTFTVFENGKYMDGDNYTNYFRINNVDFYNELSVLGWQQLKDDEYEYYRMNTLTDYREGNNPHTGHMSYDNGHKYLTYFQRIFKYVSDNDLIDYRQYDENDLEYIDDMNSFGFKNLIDEDDCEPDYDKFLREDNKCHFFGTIMSKINDECNDDRKGLSCFAKRELANSEKYEKIDDKCVEKPDSYKISDIFRKNVILDNEGTPKIENLKYGEIYSGLGESIEEEVSKDKIDNITDQIVNTKRMEIEFFIHNGKEYSKEWLEEVKYIDSVILPYLTQIIPSSVIWRVKYTTRDKEGWNKQEKEC